MRHARLAGWAAVILLWVAQAAEAVLSPRLLTPAADRLADGLTVCITIAVIGWELLDRCGLRPAVTRAEYEANRADLDAFKRNFARLSKGITEGSEPAQPLRCVREDEAAG